MSLPLRNTFETGLADETTITTANSDDGGAGNAFDNIGIFGATAVVFDTARASHGSLSCRVTQDGTNPGYVQWDASMGSQTEIWGRFYIYRTANVTPGSQWLVVPYNTSVVQNGLIKWDTTGTLEVWDSTLSVFDQSSAQVPLNEWVRIEFRLLTSASSGIVEAKMFHGDDSSPIETIGITSQNTLAEVSYVLIGQATAQATGSAFWLDDIVISATGYPGPYGGIPGRHYRRMFGPAQLGSTPATLYTVPEESRAVIRNIQANNPSGSEVAITLSIGADEDATHIYDADPIPANDFIFARRNTNYVLEAGEVLQGYADLDAAAFVGAGDGAVITTGTGTASKTGCTAGNLLLIHIVVRGTSATWSRSNRVNMENLAGDAVSDNGIITGVSVTGIDCNLFTARVTADGTVSIDLSVGASGEDVYVRIYEFSGENKGTTVAEVFENAAGGTGIWASDGNVANTTVFSVDVETTGGKRLALNLIGLTTSESGAGNFTGETGGDWTEAVAQFASGTGSTATLQLQTAEIAAAGTITGGTYTVGSTNSVVIGLAIIPVAPVLVVDGIEESL